MWGTSRVHVCAMLGGTKTLEFGRIKAITRRRPKAPLDIVKLIERMIGICFLEPEANN
jgi:hypothetical protein